jgi:hypothetical protein
MRTLDVLIGLFAAFMLVRHAPRAAALLRGEPRGRAMAVVSVVNVVLAVALLVLAVKGVVGTLISR